MLCWPSRILVLTLAAAVCLATQASAQARVSPSLGEPREQLNAALDCDPPSPSGGAHPPVLLVHGTTSTARESWGWGFAPALAEDGFTVCTLNLPDRAMVDIQRSAAYVVHAVRRISARFGRRIGVVAHSQGGLDVLWALRFWPELRAMVADVVALGTPFQGSGLFDELCRSRCAPADWQMRPGSRFLSVLNAAPPPPGPSFTSIYSDHDEVVFPQPAASRLVGAQSISIQDICPGRPIEHLAMLGDAVTYRLVLDALRRRGPADPGALHDLVCAEGPIPGIDSAALATRLPGAVANLSLFATYPGPDREPRIRRYARHA